MLDKLPLFLSDPFVSSTIGILTFLISIIFAIYLYKRAKALSRLDYASYDVEILSKKFPNLAEDFEILHKGNPVPEVTGTIAAVWNSGNQTIHKSQIVDLDKLRFEVKDGGKILKAHLVAVTRPVNGAHITIDADERFLLLEFDYLDERDGFALLITHTSPPGDCVIKGTLRGVRQGPRRQTFSTKMRLFAPPLVLLSAMLVLLTISGMGIRLSFFATMVFVIVVTLLPSFAPGIIVSQRVRRFPKEFRENSVVRGVLPFMVRG